MPALTLGVVGSSRKPDERRRPIHPDHLQRIDPELRARIHLEEGYGEPFGRHDADLAPLVAGFRTRDELLTQSDVVLLPKPLPADLAQLSEGQVLWGWPHVVQDVEMTQVAIDRGLTLIAWEAMNRWNGDGGFEGHIFHQNNELAGYCSVLHALGLTGRTGSYGRPLQAQVISFGATARGAVRALAGLGVRDITAYTQRSVASVLAPVAGVEFRQFGEDPKRPGGTLVLADESQGEPTGEPLAAALAEADVVVNCILQDTDRPLMFLTEDDLPNLRPGTLLIDVSCDPGMGFSWARATSFTDPMFTVGDGVHHYAVDHSPSYLWDAASWEISEALLPFLPGVLAGPEGWDADPTLARAIEVRDGRVVNPRVLSFQDRAPEHPHARQAAG